MRKFLLLIWAFSACAFGAVVQAPVFPFALQTSGGPVVNPGVLVGFNPQPDPPAVRKAIDLSDPTLPSVLTGLGDTRDLQFLFALQAPLTTGSHWSFVLASPPDPENVAFDVKFGDFTMFHVTGRAAISDGGRLDPASLVGFNPQPDPPGFQSFGVALSFLPPAPALVAGVGDVAPFATLAFRMSDADGNVYSFAPVPEPATAAMLLAGIGGVVAWRARRRAAGQG